MTPPMVSVTRIISTEALLLDKIHSIGVCIVSATNESVDRISNVKSNASQND